MNRFVPWLCALGGLVVFAVTLTPGPGWDDAAELAAGVDRLGSVHASGYPVYVMLGKVFVTVVPFGSAAEQANLWSAVTMAAGLGLLAHYVQRKTGSAAGAVAAVVALGGGAIVWQHAVAASVYPLFIVSVLLLLLAAERWYEQQSPARLAWLAAAVGLVVVSHRTGLVFALAALVIVIWVARGDLLRRSNAVAALAVALPLATMAYVPIQTARDIYPNTPRLFGMSAAETLNGGNERVAPEAEPLASDPAGVVRHTAKAVALVPAELSLAALFLIPLGLFALRRDRVLLGVGLAPAVAISLVVVSTPGSFSYWHLPLLLVGAILTGAGAGRLWDLARGWPAPARGIAMAGTGLALLTGPVLGAAYVHDHGQDAGPWARGVLARLPPDASVRAPWSAYAPLRAVQELEGRRPDVRLVYSDRFLRGLPDLRGVAEDYAITVGEEPGSPQRLAVSPIGGPTDVEIKGIAGLSFGPVPLAEATQQARLYRLGR